MSGYAYFAEFYDTLTQNVGYEERAEYLLSLFWKYGRGGRPDRSGHGRRYAC